MFLPQMLLVGSQLDRIKHYHGKADCSTPFLSEEIQSPHAYCSLMGVCCLCLGLISQGGAMHSLMVSLQHGVRGTA
jgi:hypothetical protein